MKKNSRFFIYKSSNLSQINRNISQYWFIDYLKMFRRKLLKYREAKMKIDTDREMMTIIDLMLL